MKLKSRVHISDNPVWIIRQLKDLSMLNFKPSRLLHIVVTAGVLFLAVRGPLMADTSFTINDNCGNGPDDRV
jgi:hypothetical protein